MTAHDIHGCGIATRSNMVFDELFDGGNDSAMIPEESPTVDTTAKKRTSRVVSIPLDAEQMLADCCAAAAPVSPCTSEETAANSITGRYTDVEDKYYVDPTVLGTGHHGSVRACVDRETGEKYAVKTICKLDPAVKRGGLAREIMLLQEMKHESVVRLVDVFEDEEYVHLVTELCEGGELFDRIVEKSNSEDGAPCFTEAEAAGILRQVLEAVSYMHRQKIVHRDIKPENILFESNEDGSPIKIIDFGLARKHFGQFGEPPMSTIVGTPYYIAPDVLRKRYDNSCDLWSVGVIAYILLCGYPPFNGSNNDETHQSVLRGRYCFPSHEWKHTSREARDFVRRLLQSDPRKRMTAVQALSHPWMARYAGADTVMADEERQDRSMVVEEERQDRPMAAEEERQDRSPFSPAKEEVPVKGTRLMPRRGSMLSPGRIAKRKLRISMFGI